MPTDLPARRYHPPAEPFPAPPELLWQFVLVGLAVTVLLLSIQANLLLPLDESTIMLMSP
jgi:hypothetical protein